MYYGFHKKKLSSTFVFNTDKNIRMISEGSCDTEDWSNDAEMSALPIYDIFFFFIKIIIL